jgi:segregation and condensation protein A
MMATAHDYRVDLDIFRGPLDLLLYLVKRDEVDIRDIPISRVAEQFREYLTVLQQIDVERVGDFLVMAATLMEIKSKLLLPRPPEATEPAEDPRSELVRQLIEYRRFKEAAAVLEQRAEVQSRRLARQPVSTPGTAPAPILKPVELWDLVSAFGRLMRETLANQPQEIIVDHTPLHVHMDFILERLARDGRARLSTLFLPPHTRSRLVGLFLAILELTKGHQIVPEQEETFSDIWITIAPAAE